MRWLVTGASGTLGAYLLRELAGETVVAWGGPAARAPYASIDLSDRDAVAAAFRSAQPDIILHCGAMARVDECCRIPARARSVNTEGARQIAELAGGARMVYVSTDLVFDGEHGPYAEDAAAEPLSVYGRSKLDAEPLVLAAGNNLVVRVSLLFGPALNHRVGFFDRLVASLRRKQPFALFADEWRTPLDFRSAAKALVTAARSDVVGRLHVGGPERVSRLEFGQRLAAVLGVSDGCLVSSRRNSDPQAEPRPRDVSLDSRRWRTLFPDSPWPSIETALADMLML